MNSAIIAIPASLLLQALAGAKNSRTGANFSLGIDQLSNCLFVFVHIKNFDTTMTQHPSEPQQKIQITDANLKDPAHQRAVLQLVDAYSKDEMGDGKPLSEEARAQLLHGLREHPTTHISIAWDGERPIGIAVCFRGFSTFAARPLLNIHDIAVLPEYRGKGVGRKLLGAVEEKARQMGCCKLTLEVLEKNQRARGAYESFGFAHAVPGEGAGHCFFMSKRLP